MRTAPAEDGQPRSVTRKSEVTERITAVPGAQSNQALARGLHILRMLVDEGTPMTATEVGRRIGIHQSSASRILATLGEVGYVRKSDNGQFEPDYGVLALGSATTRLPLITRPREVFQEIVEENPYIGASMCMLFRDEMIYLLRARSGSDTLTFWSNGFPINISAPGLRLLLDLPEHDATAILQSSRQRFGWGGRPAVVPATEAEVLAKAQHLLHDEVLLLRDWHVDGETGGAIPIRTPEPHPVALALVDASGTYSDERLTLLLHQARRRVEQAFHPED
ncbi:helix-turn-helix domain-containing protein [Propionibacteriaceae bacterium Y2011]